MKAFSLILVLTIFFFQAYSGNGFPENDPKTKPSALKTVVIDPGHGGRDPGCSANNGKEKDIVLQISKKFGNKIKAAYPDVKVIYTRTTDKFVPLNERAEIANRNKADLFISVHVNWHSSSVSGTETFVMGLHSAAENLAVAKRENSSIFYEENYKVTYNGYNPNSDEGHIWLTMVQNAYLDQSIKFANHVEKEFQKTANRKSRGIKQAGFVVLRMTTMPSVLVEAGFLSNRNEASYMMSSHGQSKLASSLFNAFSAYKKEVDGEMSNAANSGKMIADNDKNANSSDSYNDLPKLIPPVGESSEIKFRVQLSASRSSLNTSLGAFSRVKGLEVVREDGRYKYLVGSTDNFPDAQTLQNYWRANGFDGAFVVAYKGEIRISVHQAKQMAKK
ncbi:MAG: N-acetylmuramoyl-L-alanine amidase [Bacteroidota bacterium]